MLKTESNALLSVKHLFIACTSNFVFRRNTTVRFNIPRTDTVYWICQKCLARSYKNCGCEFSRVHVSSTISRMVMSSLIFAWIWSVNVPKSVILRDRNENNRMVDDVPRHARGYSKISDIKPLLLLISSEMKVVGSMLHSLLLALQIAWEHLFAPYNLDFLVFVEHIVSIGYFQQYLNVSYVTLFSSIDVATSVSTGSVVTTPLNVIYLYAFWCVYRNEGMVILYCTWCAEKHVNYKHVWSSIWNCLENHF